MNTLRQQQLQPHQHQHVIPPRVFENVLQMCKDRGYHLLDRREHEIITDKCYIIFTRDIKINISYIKELTHMMAEQELQHVIVVYNGSITINNQNIREIQQIYNIEFFTEKMFMYNLMQHGLVPKHVLVLPSDKHYDKLRGEAANLPHILATDPVAKYYNFKQGDILRIYRHDNTHAYRLVT